MEEVFDSISYCKGGSVVKMIRAVLGAEAFQTGLANYMKKFAYGNTETIDLWESWGESSGMPVKEMMASWSKLKLIILFTNPLICFFQQKLFSNNCSYHQLLLFPLIYQ